MPEFGISDEERKRQRQKLEARSAAGQAKKYQDQNRADLEIEEAMNAPPMITVGQCQTCQHPHRLWIERQVLKGRSYKAIAESLPPDSEGHQLDRRSISNHYSKGHMPLDSAIMRGVLEEEAGVLGQNFEEGVRGAFTNRGALNTLIRKAYEDAMSGVTTVEPRDLIQMVKLYNEMDSSASLAATEEAKLAVRIFMEAIQNVLADRFEIEEANEIKSELRLEIQRLRQRDDIDIEVENNLRTLPRGNG